MKSVRLVAVGQPLQDQDVPIPSPGDRDILKLTAALSIALGNR